MTFIVQLFGSPKALGADFPAPKIPQDIHDSRIHKVVGIRPFREGGIRLEAEKQESTWIIHNYGHGGAGLTLSWGTAAQAIRLASQGSLKSKDRPIIILGAGVIGLSTAFLLTEAGFKVQIHSDHFYPDTVSNIAGGLWSPVYVSTGPDSANKSSIDWGRVQLQSFENFLRFKGKEWGVYSLPLFVAEGTEEQAGLPFFQSFPNRFTVRWHKRIPIEGVTQPGYEVETFLIDTSHYLSQLMNWLSSSGTQFVQRKYLSLEQVREAIPDAAVVFNSTGLGARELVGDASVVPVRGDLLYIDASGDLDISQVHYTLLFEKTRYLFPRPLTGDSGSLVLGGTFLHGNETTHVDPKACADILKSAEGFLGQSRRTDLERSKP